MNILFPINPSKVPSQLPMLPLYSLITPLSLPQLLPNLIHPNYFLYAQNHYITIKFHIDPSKFPLLH